MGFGTEPYIERARNHLESKSYPRLFYACLELRYALEMITYQKLHLRLEKVSAKEIAAWQPRRAMEVLMELVDGNLEQDSILQIAEKNEGGIIPEDKWLTVGTTKGVSPREIGKHWQKISSYLHVKMPEKREGKPNRFEEIEVRPYLEKVINYIEEITKTGFDSYFSNDVMFSCVKCNQNIVRNRDLLKPESVVQCQNPNCIASYITEIKGDEFKFDLYKVPFNCKKCGEIAYFDVNVFLDIGREEIKIFACNKCGERSFVRWLLKYALESDVNKDEASNSE